MPLDESLTHSSGVLLGLPTLLHFFPSLGMVTEYRREMLHGNGDQSANVTRLEKLEEMQGSIVRRRMPTKLIKPAMLFMRQKRWLQRSDKKIGLR